MSRGRLVDYARIIGRATYCRERAGFLGADPPYSTRHLLETVFPKIAVAGADLPKGVTEMAVADKGRRALYYARGVQHIHQRVGLMHGLYHHLEDMKSDGELGLIRECNLSERKVGAATHRTDPLELSCDLFAAEVLIPLDVLDRMVPFDVYSRRDETERRAVMDEVDHLASKFNVPRGFLRWRLHDLHYFRRTHYSLA